MALLSDRKELSLPADFRTVIEICYGTDTIQQDAVSSALIEKADREWEADTHCLQKKGAEFALRSPDRRYYYPVGNDPVGDDSDDGNGWRAKTRLGANDRTAFLGDELQIEKLSEGTVSMARVREIYKNTVKLPQYLPYFSPCAGFFPAVEAKGKLRGLLLLPLNQEGIWMGEENGKTFRVSYDNELGLLAGRVE